MFTSRKAADSSQSLDEVRGNWRIDATVERKVGSDVIVEGAELLDISRGSIKLETSSSPSIQEAVVVNLKTERLNLNLALPAVVRWVKPSKSKAFRLGCTLSEPLAEDVLDVLANAGCVQRRREPRFETSVDGYVRWESSDERVPVRVTNISTGGLCLCIPEAKSVGERLLLEVEAGKNGKTTVTAKVRWKSEIDRGSVTNTRYYFMGCEFTDPASFEALRSL